jgi:glycosyltransferase involved in cell wall biosynthesis
MRVTEDMSSPKSLNSLTVIIPLFNSEDWIVGTVCEILQEIEAVREHVELIIVNDGSTDQSIERIKHFQESGKIRIITTGNQGRFSARATGVEQAESDYVVFIDSRVRLNPGSLKFILDKLETDGINQLWNARVLLPPGLPNVSYFWEGIEFLAWRKHFRGPQEIAVKKVDLDFHPIGTTMFGAPRQWLKDTNELIKNSHISVRNISDDTKMIRHLAEYADLNYSQKFSCTYQPRTTSGGFASHAFHRGIVFVDGHLRKGGRYVLPFVSLVALLVLMICMFVMRPFLTSALICVLVAVSFALLQSLELPKRAQKALLTYGVVFVPAYFAGVITGLKLRVKHGFSKMNECNPK